MVDSILILLFPFLMILAAVQDFMSMTISNKISLILLVAFPLYAFGFGMDWNTFLMHWVAFALTLSVTFSLFAINVMGGGDAKLIPCTVLWLGWSTSSIEYVLNFSIFGGILTVIILTLRHWPLPKFAAQIPGVPKLYNANSGIPYGIALAPAGVMAYYHSDWVTRIMG